MILQQFDILSYDVCSCPILLIPQQLIVSLYYVGQFVCQIILYGANDIYMHKL